MVGEALWYESAIACAAPDRNDPRLTKRITASVLWLVSAAMMYGLVASFTGLPDSGGTIVASQTSFQAQGPLSFAANSTFHAKALDTGPYKGILLWQSGKGCHPDAPVSLGGNGDVLIAGTIYAPLASVTLNGGVTGTGEASIQIISYQWSLSGGAVLTMPYDPTELYQFPMKGLVR